MLSFTPTLQTDATVLCLGAHCDDIEIGCGGSLLELQRRLPTAQFVWHVFSGDETRACETRAAAARFVANEARCKVEIHGFRASYFPHSGAQIKDAFEVIKAQLSPDLVFTHFLDDRHQDHRVVSELTWNTFRDHTILEYEIPKYEGDLGHPNVYVPLADEIVDKKIATLMDSFPSQRHRGWFDAELFRGHMRLRGVECNSPSRFAEAFHGRKLVL